MFSLNYQADMVWFGSAWLFISLAWLWLQAKLSQTVNNISSSNIKLLLFDASRYGESNELCFISLWSLNGELLWFNVQKKSNHWLLISHYTVGNQKSPGNFFKKGLKCIISSSSDQRITKRSSLDSSWYDASNGGLYMSLGSIDDELYPKFKKNKKN